MPKPIRIIKEDGKYHVEAYGYPVVRMSEGKLDITRMQGGKLYQAQGTVALYANNDEACAVAHKVGRYMFGLGGHALGLL